MKRRALLLAAAACACRGSEPQRWSFARAALAVAQESAGISAAEAAWSLEQLQGIAERVTAGKSGSAGDALGAVLFDELGFAREVTSTELGYVLLPSVLRHRRGSCVGLGTLYLALAQALDITASGVLRPGHFYVRRERPGPARNVELLRRGEAMPDAWYRERYPIPSSAERSAYARPLTSQEALGVIDYDIGNERRRQRRIPEARRAYASAVLLLPDFAQAHAGLGTMLHLLGEHAAAAASYDTARRLDPGLPGLEQNIALLQAETRVTAGN